MAEFVPLLMGDRVIGRIALDLDTGEFSGAIVSDATEILRSGIEGEVQSVALQYIYGRAAQNDMSVQTQFAEYLKTADVSPIEEVEN